MLHRVLALPTRPRRAFWPAVVVGLVAVGQILCPSLARAASKRRVELVLTLKDKTAKKVSAAFERQLLIAAKAVSGLEIIPPRAQLTRFTACRANLQCVADLGRKAGADAVLFGRWVSVGKDLFTLQYILVNTQSGKIDKTDLIRLPAKPDMARIVSSHLADMMQMPAATQPEPPAALSNQAAPPRDAPVAQGPVEPMPSAHQGVTPTPKAEAAASSAAGTAAPQMPSRDTAPGSTPDVPPAALAHNRDPLELDLPKAAQPLQTEQSVEPGQRPSFALLGGGAGLAVGVALVGAGAYYGVHAGQLRSSIVDGPSGTTQIRALSIGEQANNEAQRANLLFAVGGVVSAAGALLGLSYFSGYWDLPHGTATVAFGPHGTTVGILILH